jgi:hypothetical protein
MRNVGATALMRAPCTAAWFSRITVIAAALYLALIQVLTAAHAASGEARAPDHNPAACVLHIAGERMHGATTPTAPAEIVAPASEYSPFALPVVVTLVGEDALHPPSRGPPSL